MPPNRTSSNRPSGHQSPSSLPRSPSRSTSTSTPARTSSGTRPIVTPPSSAFALNDSLERDALRLPPPPRTRLTPLPEIHDEFAPSYITPPTTIAPSIGTYIAQSWAAHQASRQSAPPIIQHPHTRYIPQATPYQPLYYQHGPSSNSVLNSPPVNPSSSSFLSLGTRESYLSHLDNSLSRGPLVSLPPPATAVATAEPPARARNSFLARVSQVSSRTTASLKLRRGAISIDLESSPSLKIDDKDDMSIFNPGSSLLQARVEIVFGNDGRVDMVGSTNTSSSYSLPGHILVSLPCITRQSTMKRMLRELREVKLVVESMTEYFDEDGRYTPMRIFAQTHMLVNSSNPIHFPNFDQSQPFEPRIQIAIPFDLRLPGWIPPSICAKLCNVAHGCQATVTVGWTDLTNLQDSAPAWVHAQASVGSSSGPSAGPSSTLPLGRSSKVSKLSFEHFFPSAPPASSSRDSATATVKSKFTPFDVRRHRLPSAMAIGTPTPRLITTRPHVGDDSPVDVIVSIPEWVDLNGDVRAIKLQLRIRANESVFAAYEEKKALEEEERMQGSSSSSDPSMELPGSMPGSYESSTSIGKPPSPSSMGEATEAAASAKPSYLTYLQELGMEVEETERYSSLPIAAWFQAFPIPAEQPNRAGTLHPLISPRSPFADDAPPLSEAAAKAHRTSHVRPCLLAQDGSQRNFFFQEEGLGLENKWRKVNVVLPMPADKLERTKRPRSELDSPFLGIRHMLKLRIVCQNAVGDTEEAKTTEIVVPIRFGTQPSTDPDLDASRPIVPPYVQLYYENGARRDCDPLPLYEPARPDDPPPPFSPMTAIAPQALARPAEIHAPGAPRRPVLPLMPASDNLPEPGEAFISGGMGSRSPSPPLGEDEDEDDAMDGTFVRASSESASSEGSGSDASSEASDSSTDADADADEESDESDAGSSSGVSGFVSAQESPLSSANASPDISQRIATLQFPAVPRRSAFEEFEERLRSQGFLGESFASSSSSSSPPRTAIGAYPYPGLGLESFPPNSLSAQAGPSRSTSFGSDIDVDNMAGQASDASFSDDERHREQRGPMSPVARTPGGRKARVLRPMRAPSVDADEL